MLRRFYLGLLLLHASFSEDFLAKFHQNKYKLKNFRIEVDQVNENLVTNVKFVTHKYNRTIAVANGTFTFKVDVEDKLEVIGTTCQVMVQVYKLYSNEYRVFPIHFQVNARKAFANNLGGLQTLKNCGNIEDFYFLKDVIYVFCNFKIDETKLPPLIPNGEYKLEFQVLLYEEKVFKFSDYVEVYVPLKPSAK